MDRTRVLLFAGGNASRMFPFSTLTEKSLLPLPNGKPIIRELVDRLTAPEQPFLQSDITILCQTKHLPAFQHEFRDLDVEFDAREEPLGTLIHLREAMRKYNDELDFLVHYADMVTDINYDRVLAMHRSHGRGATAVLTSVWNPYGAVSTILDDNKLRIDEFVEKPLMEKIWTGVAVLNRRATIPYIEKLALLDRQPDIGHDLMPRLVVNKELYAYLHRGEWHDIGDTQQYLQLIEKWYKEQVNSRVEE